MTFHIEFPEELSPKTLSQFTRELEALPEQNGELKILASKPNFFTPTSLVMLAKSCRRRGRKYEGETPNYTGLNRHQYANNLGFSDALELEGRPYPQGAFGGKTYIPLSAMFRSQIEERADELSAAFGDAIEEKCEEIARIVEQGKSAHLQSVVSRSFVEIFRNCFEHGESNTAVFCAQYWPARSEVEVCIADRGIGVTKSLQESKYNKPSSDREALYRALMPGASSKAWQYKKKKAHQKTSWDNAGYGLFFAHRLFGQLGHFYIATGSRALLVENGECSEFECNVEGTVVSMRLNFSDEEKVDELVRGLSNLATTVKEKLGVKKTTFESVEAFIQKGDF